MEREITKRLYQWKESPRRKPLLLTGVRQCGKTYAIKEFGRRFYKKTVYINFEENENLKGIFEYDFDIARIIKEIQASTKKRIDPENTLLILDEIQECPRAITSLKYFCENMPELHLICAGSLLGVAIRQENFSFPVGKVNRMQMYPLNFKEYAAAAGFGSIIDILTDWPADREIPPLYRVPMEKLLRDFYAVGGMPEAVQEMLRHAFEDIGMMKVWVGYYEGNSKSKRVQEKCGFRYQWKSEGVDVPLMHEKRTGYVSSITKDQWQWDRLYAATTAVRNERRI